MSKSSPGRDEVDRDEEAEADALEAHADDVAVGRLEDEPDDEPRRERAQDEVEAHIAGEEDERGEDEDREPDRSLPGRVHRLLQHANDGGRACAECRPPGECDDGAEHDEKEHLGDGPVHAGQKDRDDDDRPELARDAVAENRRSERRLEQAGVGQDRNERPERCRRQCDAEDPALGVDTRLLEDRPGREPDRQRHGPAGRAELERAPGDALLDHLEPGEEEQEHEPQGGEELDVRVGVREAEGLRADEDAQHDLDHDGRQEQPVMKPREDGCDGRRRKDEDERADVRCDHRPLSERRGA